MRPPSRDEIREFMAESMASEGIEGEPDEVMVEGVHHAIDVMQLSTLALPDDAKMTIIVMAVLAFTYGQNATAMRLAGWLTPAADMPANTPAFVEWIAYEEAVGNSRSPIQYWTPAEITAMRDGKRPFPPLPASPGGPTT